MGRKLRTMNEVMRPAKVKSNDDDIYRNGTQVYVRNYRPGSEKWKNGVIKGKRGKVMYEVAVGGQIWIRHRNQLRRRFGERKADEPNLALELFFDTFKLPPGKPTLIAANNKKGASEEQQPIRRSERKRRAPVKFQESELFSKRGGAKKRRN
uniref:SJCHGC05088 protein n=1 Tax=Schistosoma japonicum TaxID=6182 RepID=Q5DAB9_SCHJA|nr:SJCHGC05088 protein [Schistosoma japonicum]